MVFVGVVELILSFLCLVRSLLWEVSGLLSVLVPLSVVALAYSWQARRLLLVDAAVLGRLSAVRGTVVIVRVHFGLTRCHLGEQGRSHTLGQVLRRSQDTSYRGNVPELVVVKLLGVME